MNNDFNSVDDSGKRSEFNTGAIRDTASGKGRYDLITPIGLRRVAKHYENGAKKYPANNWLKGIPLMRFLDSAERHIECLKEAMLTGQATEDHAAAVAWNMLGFMHTEEMIERGYLPKELDDRPKPYRSFKEPESEEKDEPPIEHPATPFQQCLKCRAIYRGTNCASCGNEEHELMAELEVVDENT